jgi:hypothetical protein
MKMAIMREGFTFDMMCGYRFEKSKDVFKSYVEDLYNIKKNSKNIVERNIAKLMLNSLFGRLGMKDIKSTIKIMSNEEHEKKKNLINNTIIVYYLN